MKSIKPGRGPSGMKFLNSIFSIVFGAIWTLIAIFIATGAMVAGGMLGIIAMIFPLFGVVFMINGIVHAMYNYKNATGKDRYSEFDITEDGEEQDPLDRRRRGDLGREEPDGAYRFSPYSRARFGEGFVYCAKCGRELPEIE